MALRALIPQNTTLRNKERTFTEIPGDSVFIHRVALGIARIRISIEDAHSHESGTRGLHLQSNARSRDRIRRCRGIHGNHARPSRRAMKKQTAVFGPGEFLIRRELSDS